MTPGPGAGDPGTSRPARYPASSTDLGKHDHERPRPEEDRTSPAQRPIPWRPIGTIATSIGAPSGIGLLHPMLGAAVFLVEFAVSMTVLGTALFGAKEYSERAFRLLRWVANRPEPDAPQGHITSQAISHRANTGELLAHHGAESSLAACHDAVPGVIGNEHGQTAAASGLYERKGRQFLLVPCLWI